MGEKELRTMKWRRKVLGRVREKNNGRYYLNTSNRMTRCKGRRMKMSKIYI